MEVKSMSNAVVEVAIAILYQDHQFLMQLRDDIPGIIYPGHWGFFGGHLDPGESPEETMWRELHEEIGYVPPQVTHFRSYTDDPRVIRHVFHAPLVVAVEALELNEGWDLGLLTVEQIKQGDRYSERAGRVCPLGEPHQRILLEFIAEINSLSGDV
jgi:8-oxo-dGTP diphosphatase